MYLWSYNPKSGGARDLARTLGASRIRHRPLTFRGAAGKTVINWGATEVPPEVARCRLINKPEAVSAVSNKLRFFQAMKEAGHDKIIPAFTTNLEVARGWLASGREVVCRQLLAASGGRGIYMVSPGMVDIPRAPLYTRYIPKNEEYRIHIAGGEIFWQQRKARRLEHAEPNWRIRNHSNGFIFAHDNIVVPEPVSNVSREAFAVCALDFGAVDVIWDGKNQRAYVLEINTAPGLEGATLPSYVAAIKGLTT